MPPRVFTLGKAGLNLTGSPLHVADDELLRAQNLAVVGNQLEDGIRKRDGMARVVADPFDGPVYAIVNCPIVGPTEPPVEPTTGLLYWAGMGDSGSLKYTPGVGISDAAIPASNFSYAVIESVYDGWTYYVGGNEIRRWNGTTDELFSDFNTNVVHGTIGWYLYDAQSITVNAEGVHALLTRTTANFDASVLTYTVCIVRIAFDGTINTVGSVYSKIITTASADHDTIPRAPLVIWNGRYYTSGRSINGIFAGGSGTIVRLFSMDLSGTAWTNEQLFGYSIDPNFTFYPRYALFHYEPRGSHLWYGITDELFSGTMHTLVASKAPGGSWVQHFNYGVDNPSYFSRPIWADGNVALRYRVMQDDFADPYNIRVHLDRTTDNGGAWASLIDDSIDFGGGFPVSWATRTAANEVRFALSQTTQRKVYSMDEDGVLTTRYSDENEGNSYVYTGTLVAP